MYAKSTRGLPGLGLAVALVVAACGGGGAATPTPAAPTQTATQAATAAPATAGASATSPSTGAPSLDAPAEVQAGTDFSVAWTGPNAQGDYVTIVKLGTTEWTNEDYFNTTGGSPQKLTALPVAGDYEIWYVSGADKKILVRRAIKILPFSGSLDAPASVEANKEFDVAWTGPNGTGDYVTIAKLGATKWTNEDYFNTSGGSPQKLLAPLAAGSYEIWYVIGADGTIQVRRPITVTATTATVQAPDQVAKGATFQVAWTGPNGPGDYVTIVAVGAQPGAYLSYFNTNGGTPGTLTAPDTAGDYEVWYVANQGPTVLAHVLIKVR